MSKISIAATKSLLCPLKVTNEYPSCHSPIIAVHRAVVMSKMYPSIQIPWSVDPSQSEVIYRKAGLVRTQGTLFMLPPDLDILVNTYTAPPRPKSNMSSGATALCKHYERGGASSERGLAHPFWPLPRGGNDNKNRLAGEILQKMMEDISWRNMMMLHQGVAVYEIRNSKGYGMRWTLQVERLNQQEDAQTSQTLPENDDKESKKDDSSDDGDWHVTKTTFRGFLEPIEALDHELPEAPLQNEA